MKLKYNFVVNKVADKFVAVAVGDDLAEFNGFIKMNDCGADIFELLKNEITEEEVLQKMMAKYPDATEEEATQTVTEFIAQLKEAGILV